MIDHQQILADLLVGRVHSASELTDQDWMELLALAQPEGVSPLLASALRSLPQLHPPAAVTAALDILYREATCRFLCQQAIRAQLLRRLAERELPVLLLKGAALALTCYDDPITRPMGDLDLLVPRGRIEEAARCLVDDGFAPASGSLAAELQSPRGHIILVHRELEALVEIHYELKLLGRAQKKAMVDVWPQARSVCEGAASVMRPAHAFVFLCAHMLLQHREAHVLWLYDLHRLLLTIDATEAEVLFLTAHRWQVAPCTGLALLRVRELFGTELSGKLAEWAEVVTSRDGVQARVAAQALAQSSEAPSEYLMSLLMNRNYSLGSILLPPAADLRQRLGLAADERVGVGTYAAFLARRLRNGPLHFRQLWRFWRAGSAPPFPRE